MPVTRILLDQDLVAEVHRRSGVASAEHAVTIALREYVTRRRRIALDQFAVLAADWDYVRWERRRAE
ncbi:type II toxin-antitoxin system VapB family antitoxin [Jiangella mangrovi]|uniref:Arc/MetJ family transcription regulator n=1 Tax=Jiangella mangrovi TaxID=1524084 RepID=A0A7W9GNT3_9ACTN|nr:type II toxin-antitoxin system VapB family antitoxin [Jiangella mangrovi]MBB5787102.1 Arc/MetJ family transcription regulator [Jiangella mangrovi]